MTNLLPLSNPEELITKISSHLKEAKKLSLTPLIAVIGPTASGKTALGISLARHFDGEIISADSRQIYRKMNIGTAKPDSSELAAAPHHLIDIIDPDQPFSLADYQRLAKQTIAEVYTRAGESHLPILVGGTGLYINSLTQNYLLPDSQPDWQLRSELENLAKEKGKEAVHQILEKLDPDAAANIHGNNLRYVIRAIEIAKQTGQPKSAQTAPSPYHVFYLTIDWPRAELYRRIDQRIDRQIDAGLIEETRKLLTEYPDYPPALSSLGYKEIGDYLSGNSTLEQALELFKKNTRNYAKRQLTWFRKIKSVYSIPGAELNEFLAGLSPKSSPTINKND